ncbi:unnamed protein product [Sphagnum tenellum]
MSGQLSTPLSFPYMLYWTRTRKKELQDADESKEKERKVQKKSHTATSAAMRRGAAGSLTRKTRPNNPRRNALVTSDDCASSANEPVVVGRNYIMEEKKEKLDQEGEITVVADEYSKGNHAVSDAGTVKKALPALLQAKCEVLTMEKELAMQRWRQQCMEMAKAAEMAQTLRASVETILEATTKGSRISTVPCTASTKKVEEDGVDLAQRIQQLQKSRVQRELENQAKTVQGRVETLQNRSKIRNTNYPVVLQKNKENRSELNRQTLAVVRPSNLALKSNIKSNQTPSWQETRGNDREQKETIDQLVTQVRAGAEEWAQIQGVLKHVKGEMKILQQNCDSWEQRALCAESKSAILQIEEETWRVQAQLSEQKIKELESVMAQLRATMEELKSHVASEQSQLLQACNNHGYALVLKPVLRKSSSDICKCNISSNFEECKECEEWCDTPIAQDQLTEQFLCNACASNAYKFNSAERCMACRSVQRVPDPSSTSTPRIQSLSQNSARNIHEVNDMRGKRCTHKPELKMSPDGALKSNDERVLSSSNEMTISEVERSLAQKWLKQRQSRRRPSSAQSDTSLQENKSTVVRVQPNLTRHKSDGKNPMKKPGPPSASDLKVSPPRLFQERFPLKEMCRNTVLER